MTITPMAFHVLAKPTGPICNLDCEYCFFLTKEALYPGDRFRMSDGVLETYIRQLLESQPDGEVNVATEHLSSNFLRHRLLMWLAAGPQPRRVPRSPPSGPPRAQTGSNRPRRCRGSCRASARKA